MSIVENGGEEGGGNWEGEWGGAGGGGMGEGGEGVERMNLQTKTEMFLQTE